MADTKEWKQLAEVDLETATLVSERGLPAVAVYHAHQCIEKVIKAALVHSPTWGDMDGQKWIDLEGFTWGQLQDAEPRDGHYLSKLVENRVQLELFAPAALLDEIVAFDAGRHHVATRYPDVSGAKQPWDYTEDDAQAAIELAHKTLQWLNGTGW